MCFHMTQSETKKLTPLSFSCHFTNAHKRIHWSRIAWGPREFEIRLYVNRNWIVYRATSTWQHKQSLDTHTETFAHLNFEFLQIASSGILTWNKRNHIISITLPRTTFEFRNKDNGIYVTTLPTLVQVLKYINIIIYVLRSTLI